MKVREVMSTDVEVIGLETTYKEIVERMLDRGVSGLPVVDEHGHLVGIVTEADLIRRQAFAHGRPHRILSFVSHLLAGADPYVIRRCEGLTAGEIMSQPVVTASPDDDLHGAAKTMLSHRVKRLPILSEGRPVGIISRVDLMRSFDRPDADIAKGMERAREPERSLGAFDPAVR